jgi:hypothetical protein
MEDLLLEDSLTMTDQRIDLNMLARIDSEQKATSYRVAAIDARLGNIEKDIAEIKGTIKPKDLPWAVRFILLPLTVAAMVGTVGGVIHLEITVAGIGKNVAGVQASVVRQSLTTYAALPASEFKEDLPDLGFSIAVARRQNVKVPTKVVEGLSKQLNDTETNASGYWPTTAELINYRSAINHGDLLKTAQSLPRCVDVSIHPSTLAKAVTPDDAGRPVFMPLNPAFYENCQLQLDSPEEARKFNEQVKAVPPGIPIVLRHCLVRYKGGNIQLRTNSAAIAFGDCLWEISLPNAPPPTSGEVVTKALLTSDIDAFTLPSEATHS